MSEQRTPIAEFLPLARAMRFAFVALVLCFSYFSICSSRSIHNFEQIFHDMLDGKSLPVITTFVISARLALLALSYLVPLCAVATLFTRRFVASFYLLGGLLAVTTVQFILVYHALFAPLVQIISQMQGGGQ